MLQWNLYPTALMYSKTQNNLYFSQDIGKFQKYKGTLDGVAFDGSGGTNITCTYISTWTTLNQELSGNLKIIKSASVWTQGTANNIELGVSFDYKQTFYSATALAHSILTPSRFGSAVFGVSKFTGLFSQQKAKANLKSAGNVIKFKITMTAPSESCVLKQLSYKIKVGRLA